MFLNSFEIISSHFCRGFLAIFAIFPRGTPLISKPIHISKIALNFMKFYTMTFFGPHPCLLIHKLLLLQFSATKWFQCFEKICGNFEWKRTSIFVVIYPSDFPFGLSWCNIWIWHYFIIHLLWRRILKLKWWSRFKNFNLFYNFSFNGRSTTMALEKICLHPILPYLEKILLFLLSKHFWVGFPNNFHILVQISWFFANPSSSDPLEEEISCFYNTCIS